jgi:hypothetical protein
MQFFPAFQALIKENKILGQKQIKIHIFHEPLNMDRKPNARHALLVEYV